MQQWYHLIYNSETTPRFFRYCEPEDNQFPSQSPGVHGQVAEVPSRASRFLPWPVILAQQEHCKPTCQHLAATLVFHCSGGKLQQARKPHYLEIRCVITQGQNFGQISQTTFSVGQLEIFQPMLNGVQSTKHHVPRKTITA